MLSALLLLATAPAGYKMVWHDEFNRGSVPDPKFWVYEEGFVRNKELQLYRQENVRIRRGKLIIEGRKETVPNPAFDANAPKEDWQRSRQTAEYTSGSIKTRDSLGWTYGRFECRGKFGVTLGLWPAFWMTGPTREWPANGEIDIMEYYQRAYRANVAWGSKQRWVGIWRAKDVPIETLAKDAGYASADKWAEAFHTYRMDWDPEAIRLYVDGRLLNEVFLKDTVNQSPDGANPFQEPHHLILNLAIGATGGDPNQTKWPSRFEVDWVRVFQKV
jgi:beta-glucanase (GH16 family)